MKKRKFRNDESIEAERVTRNLLQGYLSLRGFREMEDYRKNNSQRIQAITPSGQEIVMSVRLCWRRQTGSRDAERVKKYSATQILSKIKNGDWEGSLQSKVDRESNKGITHFLFVQGEDQRIVFAALVPLVALVPIWCEQRDVSEELIKSGQAGRRKKNHAMNGQSPTLWLQDERAPKVAEVFWQYPDVEDLSKLPVRYTVELSDNDANDERGHNDESKEGFNPSSDDSRDIVSRQIRARRGQKQFRDSLRQGYGDHCLITGCGILAVLEAAHIKPYRGENDNHIENGLLLRADIHTLFDLDLIGIQPDSFRIEIHPKITNEYGDLDGKIINITKNLCPSREALAFRYEHFQDRLYRDD